MSGQTIHRPARPHSCDPGWTSELAISGPFAGSQVSHPPWATDFPPGTVWECQCGRTWVSRKTGPARGPAMFSPETRRERRRRERAAGQPSPR